MWKRGCKTTYYSKVSPFCFRNELHCGKLYLELAGTALHPVAFDVLYICLSCLSAVCAASKLSKFHHFSSIKPLFSSPSPSNRSQPAGVSSGISSWLRQDSGKADESWDGMVFRQGRVSSHDASSFKCILHPGSNTRLAQHLRAVAFFVVNSLIPCILLLLVCLVSCLIWS